jgi:diguanylate cyclase (GGDEF)-like protein/PAS domain S-box-containing protein
MLICLVALKVNDSLRVVSNIELENNRRRWSAQKTAPRCDMKRIQGDVHGVRLLYVEDEASARNLLSRIIAKKYPGLKLLVAENGAAGLELFREQRPDIVLADMNMPVMDGIQMAREIKALDAGAVIIAVTAHNDPYYLQNAIEIGIRHYVKKPVVSEDLFAVINKTIEELSIKRLISEQEGQIRKREQQLATAQKIAHIGSWEWDLVSGKTSWSDELYRIFGIEPGSITASYKEFLERVHPEDREAVKRVVRGALKKCQPIISHYCRIVRPDGSVRVINSQGEVVFDDAGKPVAVISTSQDVTERRKMEEIIKHQAQHDTLTDLPNRQLFMDFLSLELAQARRNEKKLALLFLDLNGFKQVNDKLGHSSGDRLLQEVALRLRASIRASDTVARLGGDEFTVLMPDLSQTDDVGGVLKKILGVFETPFILDEAAVDITASIGVCLFPDDGACSEELMKKADIAMYDAKGSGRNLYQFYNAEINSRTIKRQNMEGFLLQAVGRGELELLFQPLVCSGTRGIIGAEALLRWRHPEQGLLAPDQFLAVAEDSGAIVNIGEWVIRNACDQAKAWNEKGYPLSVSVNLSNRQFHHAGLIEKTARILAETGLMPHQLEFDVTEKTIMTDIGFSLRNMQALTKIGVTLAIDNFGSGSSSLHLIKRMHTHRVKIDKSFILDMLSEPDDLAVVNAIIAMSHKLKMEVVASGVETEEQLSVIQQSGCDQLQGYVISKPLLPAEFEQMVGSF